DFLKANPTVKNVYVETIPPGQILKEQILAQGEINGQKTAQNPDVYGSVELKHLKKLKEAGLMDTYTTYIHNKLELMVAAGNPKNIKGAEDLGRDDLVQAHPNPVNEGIMTFYGLDMLKGLNLYDKVTGGKNCKGCWAVDNKVWFTERHHRETPARIEKGEADVGIVWSTEVLEAKSQGRKIDGVPIAAPHNMASKVSYVAGALKTGRNQENAKKYLDFLLTNSAQDIYAKYGFAKAVPEEMKFSGL
ncbi:MAG: substrate-binding domain-containing protein, partial [Gammaproteobacteria bacterium]|nr:substrate-binding domain-containing protein [Gammaproteobacteria bacterium]